MKNFTLILAIMLFATYTTKATIWTVSNDPNSPAQYQDLQTAIDNATPGDTLLVGPSVLYSSGYPLSYGNVTLNINLVIIGTGAYFDNGTTTSTEKKITYIANIYIKETSASSGASGTKIIGVKTDGVTLYSGFSNSTYTTGGISNVLIERCEISSLSFTNNGYYATAKNDTIRNCKINSYINIQNYTTSSYGSKFEGISIENNIFNGSYLNATYDITSNGSSLDSVFVRNNVFLNRTSAIFTKVPDLVIENNIFWKAEPNVLSTNNGATFNNNLCYSTTAILPGTGNIGSGNINNSNPNFTNYPSQGGVFDCSHDYSFASSSPAYNAGTDGSDIGLTGGISPFYNYCGGPSVPTIKEIIMPTNSSSVPQGGTLNVTFKAKNED